VETLRHIVATHSAVEFATSVGVSYPAHWPRLGGVDIALVVPGTAPAFLELKCGTSSDALGPCAWDLLKLALATRQGDCAVGYLMAATRQKWWRAPSRGVEFFSPSAWSASEIRDRYGDWFRQWEGRGDPPPMKVPVAGRTEPFTSVHFDIDGTHGNCTHHEFSSINAVGTSGLRCSTSASERQPQLQSGTSPSWRVRAPLPFR
jgi:hypothetical protein